MSGTVLSRLLFASFLGGGTLATSCTSLAQDLTVIRAGVKQRLSLLQTLDVKLRVWTDTEYTILPDDTEENSGEETRIHWVSDRGRVFYEVATDTYVNSLFYDGQRTLRLESDASDVSRIRWAYIEHRPPEAERFGFAVFPDLLGLMTTWCPGDLEAMLAADDAALSPGWRLDGAGFDVVVSTTLHDAETWQSHFGFDAQHGWTPAAQHHVGEHGEEATWLVEEWMTVISGVTGQQLQVPKRGRYVLRGTVNGKPLRYALVAEVDQFELPERIPNERFVGTIPSGTEVWEESSIAGQPPERHIAGGAAAIEAQAAEAARQVEEVMAEIRTSGQTFSGTPRRVSYQWVFLIVGVVLLAVGFLCRRFQSR